MNESFIHDPRDVRNTTINQASYHHAASSIIAPAFFPLSPLAAAAGYAALLLLSAAVCCVLVSSRGSFFSALLLLLCCVSSRVGWSFISQQVTYISQISQVTHISEKNILISRQQQQQRHLCLAEPKSYRKKCPINLNFGKYLTWEINDSTVSGVSAVLLCTAALSCGGTIGTYLPPRVI